jgi:hypothetical protein
VLKAEVLAQMPVEQRRVLEGAAVGLGMSIDDLPRSIIEAIGDGDATVIEDVVVEVVTDQLESVAEAPDSSRARRQRGCISRGGCV